MNYSNIKMVDIANGIGCRVSLFVSGCDRHCPECFNESAWAFDAGKPFTKRVRHKIIAQLQNNYMDGLSVLGGEPFELKNVQAVAAFVKQVKEHTGKTVWIYTGYTYEELKAAKFPAIHELLHTADILVDGAFIADQKNISLRFRGSENQRIIDLKKTITTGTLCLWLDGEYDQRGEF